ncbi:MAG: hypothetical protein IJT97_10810 [Bacteroidaceae bacterium]|nr:hypothetical protein [Bacteroidaceae bacterium]
MKRNFFVVCSMMASMLCFAQSEPDFEFEPYVFNNADSTFETPLPCESAYIKAKAGASMFIVGIGKVKSYYYIKGVASSLNIDKSVSNIIINTGGTSPQQSLSIIKLEQLESKRRWKSGEAGTFTGASSNEDTSVVLKYKKYGDSSVIISTAALEDGEYCLAVTNMMTNTKSAKVYTFSIGKSAK